MGHAFVLIQDPASPRQHYKILVADLVNWRQEGRSVGDLIRQYPGLQKKQIQAALRYWKRQPPS